MTRRTRDTMSAPAAGRRVVREAALWIAAAVGLLIFAAGAVLLVFNMKTLVFLSGSMEPHIGTGALALTVTTPAAELSEGDVISFLRSDGARVTHRISSIIPEGASFKVITKGDANEFVDAEPSYLTAADRVIWHLEGAGAVLTEVTDFKYVFPFGVLVGMTAVCGFRRNPPAGGVELPADADAGAGAAAGVQRNARNDAAADPRAGASGWSARRLGTAALAVVACLTMGPAGVTAPEGTLAVFSDGGSESSTHSSVANFLAPGLVDAATIRCTTKRTLLGVDVTFDWQAPVGTVTRYDTELLLENNPSRYHRTQSVSAASATYSLSADLLYNGRYRFAVTAANSHGSNGTAYKTADYSGSTVTCS